MNPFRNHLLLFILCVTFFLSGCHKDDDVTGPHTILTLQVDAEYPISTTDNWIFATNDSGEILDVKSYAAGETVTLISDKAGDKINVTFFNRYVSKNSEFTTYGDVPGGTVLHLKTPALFSQSTQRGTVKFTVSSFYPGSSINISNGYSTGTGGIPTSNEENRNFSFYGVPSDFLLSGYREGVPVYNWAKGVKDGDIVKLDYEADFVPCPHQRKLDFDGANRGTIFGIDANATKTIILDTRQLSGTIYDTDRPVIGYVDGFASYELWVTSQKSNGSILYLNVGVPDLSFTMPNAFNFSLQSNGMQDLSFNFSEDYTYYVSSWAYYTQDSEQIRWYFMAPSGVKAKGLSVPNEIAAKYPQIDVSKFKHTSVSLVKVIEGSYLERMPGAASDHNTLKEFVFTPKL